MQAKMESQQPLIQLPPLDHLAHPLTSAVPQGDYSQQLLSNTTTPSHINSSNTSNTAHVVATTTTTTTNTTNTTTTGNTADDDKGRRPRSKWTQEETDDLIKGCAIHGVGNWKKYVPHMCLG
jgi:hypothetical protein